MRTGAGVRGRGAEIALRAKALGVMLLIGAFFIGAGAAMIFSYHRRLTDFSIRELVQREVYAAADGIAARLDEKEKLLCQVARSDLTLRYLESPSYKGPVYEGLLRDLRTLVSSDPMIDRACVQSAASYFYCCRSDGLPPDESYSPIGRPWYDLPLARGGFVVTPPYLEQGGESLGQMGKPIISMALPVYDAARKIVGVAALDLLLTPSQKLFSPLAPRKSGYSVVMAAGGAVMYGLHYPPGGEPPGRLEEASDYPVAVAVIASNEAVLRLRDPESGRWVWAGSGTVPVTGWRIVMVFPEEGLAAEFGRFARELLGLGAVVVAVFILISVLFSSRISRVETDIRAGGERYREMFAQAPVAACVTGMDGRISDANGAFLSLTGVDPGALHGARIEEIVHPGDAAKAVELRRKAAGEGRAATELRFMKADGAPVVCDASAALLRGARPGVLIVVRDSALEKRQALRVEELEVEMLELNRIMVQREFRIKELRDRVGKFEKGPGGGSG